MAENDWIRLISLILVLVLIGPAVLLRTRGMWLGVAALFLAAIVLLMWIHQTFVMPA